MAISSLRNSTDYTNLTAKTRLPAVDPQVIQTSSILASKHSQAQCGKTFNQPKAQMKNIGNSNKEWVITRPNIYENDISIFKN